MLRAVELLIYF